MYCGIRSSHLRVLRRNADVSIQIAIASITPVRFACAGIVPGRETERRSSFDATCAQASCGSAKLLDPPGQVFRAEPLSENQRPMLLPRSSTPQRIVAVVDCGRVVQAFRSVGVAGVAVARRVATASGSFIAALNHTSLARVMFILTATPVLAALLARVMLSEPPRGARSWRWPASG
jgi:hypothetical protein